MLSSESNPMFSCIVTYYTLILLYLPHIFSKIVLSPVIILTGISLLTILCLGSIQKFEHEQKENQQKHKNRANKYKEKEKQSSTCSVESKEMESLERGNSCNLLETKVKSEVGLESSSSFVEWNVRAPLDVIYEDEEILDDSNVGILKYPSLSCYYPESDSDSSSEVGLPSTGDWDLSEDWDEVDREGLIEIALDGNKIMMMKREIEFQYEQENLIEIDISTPRYKEFPGHREALNGDISCN